MNTIVFSKDRPFQLHSLLDTYQSRVKDVIAPKLIVQFTSTDEKYMEGYLRLNEMFPNVDFVNENQYGFYRTFLGIVDEFTEDEWMSFESDDAIYFQDVDVSKLKSFADPYKPQCGRIGMSMDVNIYDIVNFNFINNPMKYCLIDRSTPMKNPIQEMCLKYPFGVQGALVKIEDVKTFLNTNFVNNPIQTEITGTQCQVFTKYNHVISNIEQTCAFCHFNNELKRYDETAGNDQLNQFFLDGYVVDWNLVNIPSLEKDMRWFNGENIGRFPIFPWDVAPKHHHHILTNCLKKL